MEVWRETRIKLERNRILGEKTCPRSATVLRWKMANVDEGISTVPSRSPYKSETRQRGGGSESAKIAELFLERGQVGNSGEAPAASKNRGLVVGQGKAHWGFLGVGMGGGCVESPLGG